MAAWSSRLSENLRSCLDSIREYTGCNHQCLPGSREKEWSQEMRMQGLAKEEVS